jgi:hypothetical protein
MTPGAAWLHPNWNLSTTPDDVSASASEPYVPVLLDPSAYWTTYRHTEEQWPLP